MKYVGIRMYWHFMMDKTSVSGQFFAKQAAGGDEWRKTSLEN